MRTHSPEQSEYTLIHSFVPSSLFDTFRAYISRRGRNKATCIPTRPQRNICDTRLRPIKRPRPPPQQTANTRAKSWASSFRLSLPSTRPLLQQQRDRPPCSLASRRAVFGVLAPAHTSSCHDARSANLHNYRDPIRGSTHFPHKSDPQADDLCASLPLRAVVR